jgi:predicted RNase H-like HicB family nuclease
MSEYVVVLEQGSTSWGAYSPDLGVHAVAESRDEVERLVRKAIEFHLEGLREMGREIPAPAAQLITVAV